YHGVRRWLGPTGGRHLPVSARAHRFDRIGTWDSHESYSRRHSRLRIRADSEELVASSVREHGYPADCRELEQLESRPQRPGTRAPATRTTPPPTLTLHERALPIAGTKHCFAGNKSSM